MRIAARPAGTLNILSGDFERTYSVHHTRYICTELLYLPLARCICTEYALIHSVHMRLVNMHKLGAYSLCTEPVLECSRVKQSLSIAQFFFFPSKCLNIGSFQYCLCIRKKKREKGKRGEKVTAIHYKDYIIRPLTRLRPIVPSRKSHKLH